MDKRLLNNICIFIVLILLYPLFFFISSNCGEFSALQFFVAFIALLFLAAINILFYKFVKITHIFYKDLIFILLSYFEFLYMFYNVAIGVFSRTREFLLFAVILLMVILFCYFKNEMKRFNTVLGVLIFIFISQFLISAANMQMQLFEEKKFAKVAFKDNTFSDLKFKKTPNIYYFYMESYMGQKGLMTDFGFSNKEFYDKLNGLGFKIYPNAFSNYPDTRSSISSTFAMKHHYSKMAWNSRELTKLVSVNKYNNTVNVLRHNGYKINYFLPDAYLISSNKNIDKCNLSNNSASILKLFLKYNKDKKAKNILSAQKYNPIIKKQIQLYWDDLKLFIDDSLSNSNAPQFFFIEGFGLFHYTPWYESLPASEKLKYSRDEFLNIAHDYYPSFKNRYLNSLQEENKNMQKMLEHILTVDKDAIIILLGDHATVRYAGLFATSDYKKSLTLVPKNKIFLSQNNVLYAERLPFEPQEQINTISNVNVFRHIFSLLTQRPDLYDKTKEKDISIIRNLVYIKDGEILENPLECEFDFQGRKKIKILGIKISYKIISAEKIKNFTCK